MTVPVFYDVGWLSVSIVHETTNEASLESLDLCRLDATACRVSIPSDL
jgi:hypothetical protein